jgi:hypothetical protein
VAENVPSILFQIVHEPPPALLPRVAGLPSQVEEVLLRAMAKDKNDRFANVGDFALALERAGGAAVSTVVGRPEIPERPEQVPDSAPAKPTTFSHTAGELDDLAVPRARLKWTWVLAAGAALGLALATFLFFRPGPAAKTVIASPPSVAVAPTPPPPAPPPRAEPPAAPAPSVQEIKPEPPAPEAKAETSHRAREAKPAKKKSLPAKKDRTQENQDRWRIDE